AWQKRAHGAVRSKKRLRMKTLSASSGHFRMSMKAPRGALGSGTGTADAGCVRSADVVAVVSLSWQVFQRAPKSVEHLSLLVAGGFEGVKFLVVRRIVQLDRFSFRPELEALERGAEAVRSRAWPVLDAGKAQNQFPVALPRRREVYVLDRKAFRRPSIAQQFLVAVADLPQYETGGVVNEDSILALQELLDARGFQPAVVLHRQQVVPCADASILHVSAGIQTLAVQSYHA